MSLGVQPNFLNRDNYYYGSGLSKQLVFKLLKGEDLNPSEIDLIKNSFYPPINDEEVTELAKFLTIKGKDHKDINSLFDINPFLECFEQDLLQKRGNLKNELIEFDKRMKKVFGENYPHQKHITSLIESLYIGIIQEDEFTKAVIDLQQTKQNQTIKSNGKDFELNFDDDELDILTLGALSRNDVNQIYSKQNEKKNAFNKEHIDRTIKFNYTMKDWLDNLRDLMNSVTPSDKIILQYLEKKVLNLETLDESDKGHLQYFLSLKASNIDDNVINKAFEDLNKTIEKTKQLTPPIIENIDQKAALIAHNAKLDNIIVTESDSKLLMEALRLLNQNPPNYNKKNDGIKKAENLFESHLKDLTEKEKPLVLRNLLNKLLKQLQNRRAEEDTTHHSKADQRSLYDDFKNIIFKLDDLLNSGNLDDETRNELVLDLKKYLRGETISPSLKKHLEKANLKDNLDYFLNGYGDPNSVSAILDLLGQNTDGTIDFNTLVQSSSDFEDLAKNLHSIFSHPQSDEFKVYIPNDLLRSPEMVNLPVLTDLANCQPKIIKDEKDQEKESNDFQIFNLLNFNTNSLFTLPKNKDVKNFSDEDFEKIGEELLNHSPKLYKLLEILTQPSNAQEIGKKIAKILSSPNEDNKASIPNNAKQLAEMLYQDITNCAKHIEEYTEYKEGKTEHSYSTSMETQKKLIEFSKEYNTNFFETQKIPAFLSVNEYKDILLNFAMASKDLNKVVKSIPEIDNLYTSLPTQTSKKQVERENIEVIRNLIKSLRSLFAQNQELQESLLAGLDDDDTSNLLKILA
jgi:hypothetical protein